MVRVLSPLVVAVMLFLFTLSAAGATLATGASGIRAAVSALAAAQPRTAGATEAIAGISTLPSTSTADYLGLIVGLALLAAAAAFVLSVRRRVS